MNSGEYLPNEPCWAESPLATVAGWFREKKGSKRSFVEAKRKNMSKQSAIQSKENRQGNLSAFSYVGRTQEICLV
jgi:hypothetical protein